MSLAITLRTAPRPRPTLDASLASLRAAGFAEPVLIVDDATRARGVIGNFQAALIASLDQSAAEWLLHAEDDATWRPGAHAELARAIGALRVPSDRDEEEGFGVLSLHCTRLTSQRLEACHARGRRLAPGVYAAAPGAETRGAMALVFSRASAAAIASAPHFLQCVHERAWLGPSLGLTLRELARSLLYLLPCLATHELGARNSCWSSDEISGSPTLECDY